MLLQPFHLNSKASSHKNSNKPFFILTIDTDFPIKFHHTNDAGQLQFSRCSKGGYSTIHWGKFYPWKYPIDTANYQMVSLPLICCIVIYDWWTSSYPVPGLINIIQQGIRLDNNIIVLSLLCRFPAVISKVQISGRATEGSLQTWKAN